MGVLALAGRTVCTLTAVWWSLQSHQIRFPVRSALEPWLSFLHQQQTQLVDTVISRLKSIHKQTQAAHTHTHTQTNTNKHIDRGCLCSCLSPQLLPVRGGHFQLGDTANIIIQSGPTCRPFKLISSVCLTVCLHQSNTQNALGDLDTENVFLIDAIWQRKIELCFVTAFSLWFCSYKKM